MAPAGTAGICIIQHEYQYSETHQQQAVVCTLGQADHVVHLRSTSLPQIDTPGLPSSSELVVEIRWGSDLELMLVERSLKYQELRKWLEKDLFNIFFEIDAAPGLTVT